MLFLPVCNIKAGWEKVLEVLFQLRPTLKLDPLQYVFWIERKSRVVPVHSWLTKTPPSSLIAHHFVLLKEAHRKEFTALLNSKVRDM